MNAKHLDIVLIQIQEAVNYSPEHQYFFNHLVLKEIFSVKKSKQNATDSNKKTQAKERLQVGKKMREKSIFYKNILVL
jgi:hypothetical protein